MTDKKHIHYDKILEWAADPSAEWQSESAIGWINLGKNAPLWNPLVNYRRKPDWFDMEQLWIANGKPPVEHFS